MEKKKCYSYNVTIKNESKDTIKGWNMRMIFKNDIMLDQTWCSKIDVQSNELNIEPTEFNSDIIGEGCVTFGFNCNSSAAIDVNDITVTYTIENTDSAKDNANASTKDKKSTNTDGITPVSEHGRLSVKGTMLVDNSGKQFSLKGVSTHGIQWYGQYVNLEAFTTLRDDWGINVVRLAMYTDPNEGYTDSMQEVVDKGVEYATELGLYVIIDWHILSDGNPNTYKDNAISYFSKVSDKYKDYENVIYEICNEPNGDVKWEKDIKPYATDVISAIRKNDKNGIIIVGSSTWSQDVDVVAKSPIKEYENIAYTLHFYAATHKDDLRKKMNTAIQSGLCIFVSEFGICDASGNGSIDYSEADKWIDELESNNISYVIWNLSNKNETCALIKNSCDKTSGWTTDELSDAGKWFVELIK